MLANDIGGVTRDILAKAHLGLGKLVHNWDQSICTTHVLFFARLLPTADAFSQPIFDMKRSVNRLLMWDAFSKLPQLPRVARRPPDHRAGVD
jgi:hypothetical protein